MRSESRRLYFSAPAASEISSSQSDGSELRIFRSHMTRATPLGCSSSSSKDCCWYVGAGTNGPLVEGPSNRTFPTMRSTRVALRLALVVLVSLGALTGGAVGVAMSDGGLAPPAIMGGLALGSAVALCWLEIRRLRTIIAVARRLANSELGVAVDHPGDGVLG